MKPLRHVSVLLCMLCALTQIGARRGTWSSCGQDGAARRRPEKSIVDKTSRRPWEINQNLCPPVLCPLTMGIVGYGDDNEVSVSLQSKRAFSFFEGDIILDAKLKRRVMDKKTLKKRRRHLRTIYGRSSRRYKRADVTSETAPRSRVRRAIVLPIKRFWKNGVVPYEFDEHIDDSVRRVIIAAFRHYEKRTCIRFKPKVATDIDFILYMRQPGCWSNVGVKGGVQVISIGPGCEQLGTVLHETGHALGFWHEQSRPDRDLYVKVVKKNIPDMALEQFQKRSDAESTSRGFAYDYRSIMHYGSEYFSMNGRRTLKVIKIGKKHRFQLGQRIGLSELDIAQLRDMYRCNERDTGDKKCNKGWLKHANSCYKFIANKPAQFNDARRACARLGSHLLHIETPSENSFVISYLQEHFSDIGTWRTGLKLVGQQFVWFTDRMSPIRRVYYTAWCAGHPARYKTMALSRMMSNEGVRFQWRGVWTGSSKNPRNYAYAYICERHARGACFSSATMDGSDYRGSLDYSEDGITCQRWTSTYPHNHTTLTGNIRLDEQYGLGPHNHCRNPAGRRARPWCYVLLRKTVWQYCDVQICPRASLGNELG